MIFNRTFIESILFTKIHDNINYYHEFYQIKFIYKIPCNKWFLTELLLNQNFIQKFHVINKCYQELLLNKIYL
jgi:hypothetical protein